MVFDAKFRVLATLLAGGAMGLGTIIISTLAGIALGLRHNVLIVLPGVILAMLFAMMVGIARAEHFWSIILGMAILGIAIQFGYLVGIAIRAIAGSIRAPMTGGRNPELNSEIGRI